MRGRAGGKESWRIGIGKAGRERSAVGEKKIGDGPREKKEQVAARLLYLGFLGGKSLGFTGEAGKNLCTQDGRWHTWGPFY